MMEWHHVVEIAHDLKHSVKHATLEEFGTPGKQVSYLIGSVAKPEASDGITKDRPKP